ncbi:MAG: hypothetical protein IT366_23985 [Candidatus Hydrogenedentes bacterium]|nr:hypothetical protein [Candidatus Hydrogenedentota bacterium]
MLQQTPEIAKNIFGDELYQVRARAALPLLVRQAQACQPIYYSNLASELSMPNARNLNFVLGSIGVTINELSDKWGENIPPIECLVINKATGLPGSGVDHFLTNNKPNAPLSRVQKRILVQNTLAEIFIYPKWPHVLRALSLKPVKQCFDEILAQASSFAARGEGEDHRRLKEFIARNPNILFLPPALVGETEFRLPSGDCIDVLFKHGKEWVVAEVKSQNSSLADLVRGMFQCVKYEALIEALQASSCQAKSARAVLVLGGHFPQSLIPLKHILRTEVIDAIEPK